jgi:hypothetical protein
MAEEWGSVASTVQAVSTATGRCNNRRQYLSLSLPVGHVKNSKKIIIIINSIIKTEAKIAEELTK